MARASTPSWLGLDRWAEILTINPLHFNSLYINETDIEGDCPHLWQQYSYQDPTNVSREDVARCIFTAEQMIANYLGANLVYDWTCEEEHTLERARVVEGFNAPLNVRGQPKSVIVERKRVVAGGVRAVELIAANVTICFDDLDNDGYDESAHIQYNCACDDVEPCDPVPLLYPACDYRIFYPGHGGDPAWEIKPYKVEITGAPAQLYIYFYSWQVVQEEYVRGGFRKIELEADDDVYLTGVDLYRVYNDVSQQATLIWNSPFCALCSGSGCAACSATEQAGCLIIRDSRRGILAYTPATYDAETLAWTHLCSSDRQPDKVRVNYYSGLKTCDCHWQMSTNLENAVAYLAASLLDKDVCDCNHTATFINSWREDLAASGENLPSFVLRGKEMIAPFGTRRGAIEAYRIIDQDPTLRVAR